MCSKYTLTSDTWNIQAYLERIDYHGSLEPTAETLRALHVAHLLAVPFENLNIGMGWPIVLDQAALFEKIVMRRRGGFCYELNGLFAALLRALGFDVTLLSAGVARAGGGFGPEFDHLTLQVTTAKEPRTGTRRVNREPRTGTKNKEQSLPCPSTSSGTAEPKGTKNIRTTDKSAICNLQSAIWLADVGFGDSFREPLRFNDVGEQWQAGHAYRIAGDGERPILERSERDGVWEPQYRFTLQPRRHEDFAEMCHYHQTSPESSFTRRRVCTRATPDGRVTLSDMRLIVTRDGERQERQLVDEAEVRIVLREYFGVELDQTKNVKHKT
jgi:N-hydroxyarylamine O-acetyltransferase